MGAFFGGLFGPGPAVLEATRQSEALADKVSFRYQGRGWDFWRKDWKPADPAKAARLAVKNEATLQVKVGSHAWLPLEGATGLATLHALEFAPDPLASNLKAGDAHLGEGGPLAAYRQLQNGGSVQTDLGRLSQPDQAAFLAYLEGADAQVAHPDQAANLVRLRADKIEPQSLLEAYSQASNGQAVPVFYRQAALGDYEPAQPFDANSSQLLERARSFDRLAQAAPDTALKDWSALKPEGNLERQLAATIGLRQRGCENPAELIQQVAASQDLERSLANYSLAAPVLPDQVVRLHGQLEGLPDEKAAGHLALVGAFPADLDGCLEATLQHGPLDRQTVASLARLPVAQPEVLARRAARYQSTGLGHQLLEKLVMNTADAGWQAEGSWTQVSPGVYSEAQGDYPNNANQSLSRRIDLSHHRGCRLSFELATNLEKGYDQLHVEVRKPGAEWQTLEAFTGTSSGQHEYALAAFDGGPVEVRFRLSSDASNNGPASRLGSIKLVGTPPYGGPAEDLLESEQASGEVLAHLLDGEAPIELLKSRLERLSRLDKPHGSALLTGLALEGSDKLEQARQLEAALGSRPARALLEKEGTAADKIALFSAASELSRDGLDQALDLYHELQARKVDPQSFGRLVELAVRSPFDCGGVWGQSEPGQWCTNPNGGYGMNRNDFLTLEPIDLTQAAGTRLSFSARHQLEQNYDKVDLEVSSDGRNFTTLTSYTGGADWKEQQFDLTAFEGGRVFLRFHLSSDASNDGDGFYLKDLKLTGRRNYAPEREPETIFDTGAESRRQALSQLHEFARQSPAQIPELAELAQSLGNVPAALKLWPALQSQVTGALAPLVGKLGVEPTQRLASRVLAGDVEKNVERVMQGWDFAQELLKGTSQPPRLDDLVELTDNLARLELDPNQPALANLGQSLSLWKAEGDWRRHGETWVDSLPGGDYAPNLNQSLTTHPLNLAGTVAPVVEFEARHQLEQNYDKVILETKRGDGQWHALKEF
ncbi:MAG: immune inhibitor A, partial [Candidatus Eremiobacteraeota bacterium]|nr:immune inhibitor A [Candidatus Eremiobacteraeota bacterium]